MNSVSGCITSRTLTDSIGPPSGASAPSGATTYYVNPVAPSSMSASRLPDLPPKSTTRLSHLDGCNTRARSIALLSWSGLCGTAPTLASKQVNREISVSPGPLANERSAPLHLAKGHHARVAVPDRELAHRE